MSASKPEQIIIIKKVVNHGAHHGGAWKVAYADFVTAMMALFIVLWLMSSSEQVKKAVGGYFLDPTGRRNEMGSGLMGSGDSLNIKQDDMAKLKDKLQIALMELPQFQKMKNQVLITVTGEGLRIELLETEKGMFFGSGSATPSVTGTELLRSLAHQLGSLPNAILIEGHTDAQPFATGGDYSNWELSADRANAARRVMESGGLGSSQVKQVRGFAAQNLRKPKDPQDASNRRISVIVQYLTPANPLLIPGQKAGHDEKAVHGEKSAQSEKPAHSEKLSPTAPEAHAAHKG